MCSLWAYPGLSVGTDPVTGSKRKYQEGQLWGGDGETAQLGAANLKEEATSNPALGHLPSSCFRLMEFQKLMFRWRTDKRLAPSPHPCDRHMP